MKVIMAGSRGIEDYALVKRAISKAGFAITEVVSGGAAGVDTLWERYAEEYGLPIKRFLPKWEKYGFAAGSQRNRAMSRYAKGLVLIWD